MKISEIQTGGNHGGIFERFLVENQGRFVGLLEHADVETLGGKSMERSAIEHVRSISRGIIVGIFEIKNVGKVLEETPQSLFFCGEMLREFFRYIPTEFC